MVSGNWTLEVLSYAPSSFNFLFSDWLSSFCPGLLQIQNPLTLACGVAGIIGVCHHSQLSYSFLEFNLKSFSVLKFSLVLMTFTVFRSAGQMFHKMFLHWNSSDVFVMIRLGPCFGGGRSQSAIFITHQGDN